MDVEFVIVAGGGVSAAMAERKMTAKMIETLQQKLADANKTIDDLAANPGVVVPARSADAGVSYDQTAPRLVQSLRERERQRDRETESRVVCVWFSVCSPKDASCRIVTKTRLPRPRGLRRKEAMKIPWRFAFAQLR